ncbi:MAG: RNA polymerase sigma factor [Bernardetiaceae bacterium]
MEKQPEHLHYETLIEGCRKGKAKAQSALYQEFAPNVMGVCVRYAPRAHEAEDIFQEAFIKIFKHIGKVREPAALPGWIRRLAANTAIDYFHQQKKHLHHSDTEDIQQEDTLYEDAFALLSTQELLGYIQELPDGYRIVFNMYVIEGYAHKEIAERLGISEGTSKSQLARAKQRLRQCLPPNKNVCNNFTTMTKDGATR